MTDVAAGLLAGTQLPTVAQPVRPAPDGRSPAGSGDLKSRVSAPFTGTKKKLKQAAPPRPASPNGSNGGPVSVKSRTGAVRAPAAQPARQGQPAKSGTAPEVRDAQLVLARIEPWSVMKFSFMISLIGWVALFIVVAVFYFMFSALGVFHSIEQTIGLVTSSKGNPGSNASSWFSAGTVLGFTMIAGAVDVVLITALATFGAAIYNLVTRLSGGIEVTLQEAD